MSVDRHLHIVCLEAPWPADHGRAIDMLGRIISLHDQGIRIHLHYFGQEGTCQPCELNRFCETVSVYGQERTGTGFSQLPRIISSRVNKQLIHRLQQDHHPILIEGIHCTGILQEMDTKARRIVVRMHADEILHQKEQARAGHGFSRELYFYNQSRLLRKYSHHLPDDCVYACVSEKDVQVLKNEYHLRQAELLSLFPAWQKISGQEGQGNFCLYHGNLAVPENEEAVAWLICKVFTKARVPFVVAGKNPSKKLQKIAGLCQHTCLVADPSEQAMSDLVKKAHIHTLPCFHKETGNVRFKLLHALLEGRHCVVNDAMVAGTGLEDACHIGTNANAFASIILQLHHYPFTREEVLLRQQLLGERYDNEKNVRRLSQWLW